MSTGLSVPSGGLRSAGARPGHPGSAGHLQVRAPGNLAAPRAGPGGAVRLRGGEPVRGAALEAAAADDGADR